MENAVSDEERALSLRQCARNLDVQNRTYGGAHRYCHYTKCIKPDRSHYCSVMDFYILYNFIFYYDKNGTAKILSN